MVQNGKYLTCPKIDHRQTWNFSSILSIFDSYPKINHKQTWNFSLILSIFYFKYKIPNQKATNNG